MWKSYFKLNVRVFFVQRVQILAPLRGSQAKYKRCLKKKSALKFALLLIYLEFLSDFGLFSFTITEKNYM